jgi:hypothetical protein
VDAVKVSRTPPAWIIPYWAVEVIDDGAKVSPKMQIKNTKQDDGETLLHELLHYYTFPYLYAGERQKKWQIEIADATQKKRAVELFDTMKRLRKEATNKWFKVINGSSIEDTITEFVATITQPDSAKKLKDIDLYDNVIDELKKHIAWISTVDIAYTNTPRKA